MKNSDSSSVFKLQGEGHKRKKERNKVPVLNFILVSFFFYVISKTAFAFSLLNKLHMAMQFSLKSLA